MLWRALLVLVLLAAPAAAQQLQSALLTQCKAVAEWTGVGVDGNGTFPAPGTTFCPLPKAFEKFAKDAGYKTWQEVFNLAQANPAAWRPFLERIMRYSRTAAYIPAALVPKGASTVETLLVQSLDQNGDPDVMAPLNLERGGDKGKLKISFVRTGASNKGKTKAQVQEADLLKTEDAVVHGVDRVVMPPDTYISLYEALKAMKGMKTTGRHMRRLYEKEVKDPSTWATLVAPTDEAWKGMDFKKPYPAWTGNVTAKEVRRNKNLGRAMMQYSFIKLPHGDMNVTLDHNRMFQIWRMAAAQNFVSLPTGLTVGKEQQMSYYTYDYGTDKMYIVGHRNFEAEHKGADTRAYVAGGELQPRTVYAGCSTIVFTGGFVPLPRDRKSVV